MDWRLLIDSLKAAFFIYYFLFTIVLHFPRDPSTLLRTASAVNNDFLRFFGGIIL
jgi:hypothetical protein